MRLLHIILTATELCSRIDKLRCGTWNKDNLFDLTRVDYIINFGPTSYAKKFFNLLQNITIFIPMVVDICQGWASWCLERSRVLGRDRGVGDERGKRACHPSYTPYRETIESISSGQFRPLLSFFDHLLASSDHLLTIRNQQSMHVLHPKHILLMLLEKCGQAWPSQYSLEEPCTSKLPLQFQ